MHGLSLLMDFFFPLKSILWAYCGHIIVGILIYRRYNQGTKEGFLAITVGILVNRRHKDFILLLIDPFFHNNWFFSLFDSAVKSHATISIDLCLLISK